MAASRTRSVKNKKTTMSSRSLGGFTIIEVVLVLAIAGLIFMMVFIALPQLQRAQRDTQRRQDMADLQAAIAQYQSNNNGKIPETGKFDGAKTIDEMNCGSGTTRNDACRLIKVYMNSVNAQNNSFLDPQGEPYKLYIEPYSDNAASTVENSDFDDHIVYMFTKAKCSGEEVESASNSRDYALMMKLEGSGTYCHGNND